MSKQHARGLGLGLGEHLRHAPLLNHTAALEHRNVVADLLDDVHGVGDYHQRHAGLAVDVAQQLEDGVGALGVERGGRLVAEDHLGLAGQCAGDGNALLLPAGQLAGIAPGLLTQTDAVEQLERAGAILLRHLAGSGEERKAHVVQHGLLREQAEVLENHGHPTTIRAQLLAGQGGDVAAIDLDSAQRGALEQVDGAHERRLAGVAHADDAENVTVGNLDVDIGEGVDEPVGLDGFIRRLDDGRVAERRVPAHRGGIGHVGPVPAALLAGRLGCGE